jgi:hypothetical protein
MESLPIQSVVVQQVSAQSRRKIESSAISPSRRCGIIARSEAGGHQIPAFFDTSTARRTVFIVKNELRPVNHRVVERSCEPNDPATVKITRR